MALFKILSITWVILSVSISTQIGVIGYSRISSYFGIFLRLTLDLIKAVQNKGDKGRKVGQLDVQLTGFIIDSEKDSIDL